MKLTIRHCKMRSGKIFTIYAVKRFESAAGFHTWRVFCGSSTKRPQWVRLNFPGRNAYKVKPWFYFDGEKLYLTNFEPQHA